MPLQNPPSTAPAIVVPPGTFLSSPATAWPASNRAIFMRFTAGVGGTYRYINWRCGTQSGNIQLGVVTFSGAGHINYTRVAHTGVIACPAGGASYQQDLGAFYLPAGDHGLFLWADNTTFQASLGVSALYGSARVSALHSSLASGVDTTGTLSTIWGAGTSVLTLTLEGDI